MNFNRCIVGDCRAVMRDLIADGVRVQCIVTSPPYWGLRDYGVEGQLGLEPTFPEWLETMVEVFDLCRQMLADDGTLWLNMGDSYNTGNAGSGVKYKDVVGQPWRFALAMQDAGWWLRQDIIWSKPNPMPESVRDRCTKAHEYLFLLAKSERYYFDAEAIKEPVTGNAHERGTGVNPKAAPSGWDTGPGGHRSMTGRYPGTGVGFGHGFDKAPKPRAKQNASFSAAVTDLVDTRNRRSVWTIPTQAFEGAHFATFPEALVAPCILAGSRPGDIVFDPFLGSGTVASVAQRLGRRWLGIELKPEYLALQALRTRQAGLQLETA